MFQGFCATIFSNGNTKKHGLYNPDKLRQNPGLKIFDLLKHNRTIDDVNHLVNIVVYCDCVIVFYSLKRH